ncbi:hypothetical protein OG889_27475 [Streptomyces sp. NBC_00481]|uniref:hypothetical protein n=1 Tax=unclassified Streptomyces TaxID=2593676 RepID=UPI002DD91577|nr:MULTISPECIES: hypothetical protein [unclassified Streptomyces]WRY98106.1 hypothetical protein OG889_27475 [Streptomyces sp. NBC_00481]
MNKMPFEQVELEEPESESLPTPLWLIEEYVGEMARLVSQMMRSQGRFDSGKGEVADHIY